MNPDDTLRLVLDHQAAMRREARIHSLARTVRNRRHRGVSAGGHGDALGAPTDPLGVRRFLDQ